MKVYLQCLQSWLVVVSVERKGAGQSTEWTPWLDTSAVTPVIEEDHVYMAQQALRFLVGC